MDLTAGFPTQKIFTLHPQFELEMEVKITGSRSGVFFHVGFLPDNADPAHNTKYGHYSPQLYYHNNELVTKFDHNGIQSGHQLGFDVQLGQWYNLKLSQLLANDGKYMYRFVLDGLQEFLVENTQPAKGEGAIIWNNYYGNIIAEASVRNIRFVTHDCASGTYFNGQDCVIPGYFRKLFLGTQPLHIISLNVDINN